MITFPAGWSVERVEASWCLVPPAGPSAGAIRYVERARPLRSLRSIAALHTKSGFVASKPLATCEQLVTVEGEFAGFTRQRGALTPGGPPVERSWGAVFGDDFYGCCSGLALAPEWFALIADTVRLLTLTDRHQLGVRRRRYLYQPPAGWQGSSRLFDTTWRPPHFPRARAELLVCPAVPMVPGLGEQLLSAALDGRSLSVARKIDDVARGELAGSVWSMPSARAPDAETRIAILGDGLYVYPLRLDADSRFDEGARAFAEVVTSVRSLRHTVSASLVGGDGQLLPAASALLSYWT